MYGYSTGAPEPGCITLFMYCVWVQYWSPGTRMYNIVYVVYGYSTGAPEPGCITLEPGHGNPPRKPLNHSTKNL